jgi:hypothetical protein
MKVLRFLRNRTFVAAEDIIRAAPDVLQMFLLGPER